MHPQIVHDAPARVRNPQNGPPWSSDPLYFIPIPKNVEKTRFYPTKPLFRHRASQKLGSEPTGIPNAAHCGSLAILASSRDFRGGSISRAREFDSSLGFAKLQIL